MDLKEFYLKSVKESEYHYRFLDSIRKVNYTYNIFSGKDEETENYKFEIYDVEDAIAKFRELCQPDVNFSNERACWFYLITYYLHTHGYEIKEFPRVLARPPVDPTEFTYKEIIDYLIAQGKDDNGVVRFATRRVLIAGLTFTQKYNHIEMGESINQKIIEISTRQATFDSMSTDEKIAEIVNLIENMLKQQGEFVALNYSEVCCGLITDTEVKKYRKKLQCFRHSTDEALHERKSYSESQKNFLIDYGLTIVKAIHSLL